MILILGPTTDSILTFFLRFLKQRGYPYLFLDQEEMLRSWSLSGNEKGGWTLHYKGKKYPIESFSGIYMRLSGVSDKHPIHFKKAQQWLVQFLDLVPIPVVNRPQAMGSNYSKPYQLQIIKQFLPTPRSLVSNNPEKIEAFCRQYPECIFKSVSSERSIVQPLALFWKERQKYLETSPILVQPKLKGPNVRVHVIGEQTFALRIESESIDYRYAKKYGKKCFTQEVLLSKDLHQRCVALAKELGLSFAGIDLIYDGPESLYCLEANPSPGYVFFEDDENMRITNALANYLMDQKSLNQSQQTMSA